MKKIHLLLILLSVFTEAFTQDKVPAVTMGNVTLQFEITPDGVPGYSVSYAGKPVIKPSQLGFVLSGNDAFNKGFKITGINTKAVDENWRPVWGEVSSIRNNYKQLTVHLQQEGGRMLDIVFRVFADGVGFRYEFPKQPGLKYFIVTDELTEFTMAGDHKTFWIPGDYDSNEYKYSTSKISQINNIKVVTDATDIAVRVAPDKYAVQTPLMMKSADGLYINIHEAALINYSSMQLHTDTALYKFTSSLVPDAVGNKAYLHAPFNTPWRTIIVSNKAVDVLASKIILNLNEPSAIANTEWIKPMKFVGVWWEMQTGKGTWSYATSVDDINADGSLKPSGAHSANTANVKRYIDFASANGIGGVLVEGWNTGWEDWFGNWKENVFDFVTPYPDFDVAELNHYAASKGVKMIMHNETSGSATNYERQLDTAFKFMNQYGYPAVKTGYVGRIIPRGEHHDGQWMANHYLRVIQKAAERHVSVDAHEPMRPTGLHRTYPNFMASEAGRGNEYNAFSNGNPPEHETILPFTRLMGGPMDYTPGIFKLKGYAPGLPDRQVYTTLAKQLALYVTLYTPLQMVADLPENYALHMDAFKFIKDVPVDWEDTRIIEAEPGDYLTIARKGKGTNDWFIGAITDENARASTIPLDFLPKGQTYKATIYADAEGTSYKDKPEKYVIKQYAVKSGTKLRVKLGQGGGAAISLTPVTKDELKWLIKYK
ncbi:glycoside hydrolase family 97 protein [Mucilaginibacter limnophilus]|uniref:Glycoside hydrolase family 97 protein n=1 Tax=Mucilaginibacter limnophilus TaxID=1932778 RepID=A0A437MSR3_9SPHI|nr:glycoside hydrolase family 97 protein [Mucilaginibacter limnophilus]RVU00676.1 glycoside hydrolase family 97 protein [Mucilaginibacter limnophilus]